jgi:hypothetical protein
VPDGAEARPAGARPATAAPLRRQPATAAAPPRAPGRRGGRDDGTEERDPRRIIGIALGAVAGVVLVVLLVTQVFGGGGGGSPASKPNTVSQPQQSQSSAPSGGPSVNRSSVTVAVLNGTTVPGLAAQVADQVSGGGFARGQVTNAADQQRGQTTVQYAPGQKRAAEEVASLIKLSKAKVTALDANTQAIAGPDAEVVVTVGADRTQ